MVACGCGFFRHCNHSQVVVVELIPLGVAIRVFTVTVPTMPLRSVGRSLISSTESHDTLASPPLPILPSMSPITDALFLKPLRVYMRRAQPELDSCPSPPLPADPDARPSILICLLLFVKKFQLPTLRLINTRLVGKAFAAATSIVFGGATFLFVYVAYKLELHTTDDIRIKVRELIQPGAETLMEQMGPFRAWNL
ncbi:hypothetical protein ZIOFF_028380 [Zingiber officinale]|uniref:Transmembrane protein n=1 Tax=Zingiber officinale TaxID=94328 RepID=A0A8J5L3J0_ZINOF|nr:hypothetical protein ZIOFF_028380 [Zingiber officinale]